MIKKQLRRIMYVFAFVLLVFNKGDMIAQENAPIIYSAQKCIERIHYYYHQCTFCYNQKQKPIYWGKLVSINSDKDEWEFVFVQTKQGGEATVCNFYVDAFFDNEDYLLIIDNGNLLSSSKKTFDASVDSSIFFVEEYSGVSDILNVFDPIVIWCRISYHEQDFFVDAEWQKPYFIFPDYLQVFEFKLPSYMRLVDKQLFEKHEGEIIGSVAVCYDCENIFRTKLLGAFNSCVPIPHQLFRDRGIMTVSNPFSLFPKRVSFEEKYQFR